MQISHIDTNLPYKDVTGVILAGGRSRRMGRDKATLEIDGQSMARRLQQLFSDLFRQVLIAGDRPDLATADCPCYADIYPGSSLGGLYTGLEKASHPWIFIAACDLPRPDDRVIQQLLAHRDQGQAVMIRTDRGYEPLFAAYHKSCLPAIQEMLEQQQYRIQQLPQKLRTAEVCPDQLPDDWSTSVANLNTPDDVIRWKKEFS